MAEEEVKKIESESPSEPPPHETPKEVAAVEEKSVIPVTPPPPPTDKKSDDSKALAVVETEPIVREGSINRDKVLERIATEKRLSLIRAWEESEKSKAENNANKKLSAVGSWENRNKAIIEADLKKFEEKLEKKKAEYVEKIKNKIALIHKAAEEKRAMIEAKHGEDLLKAEEMAAKYRATGTGPKKLLGCF